MIGTLDIVLCLLHFVNTLLAIFLEVHQTETKKRRAKIRLVNAVQGLQPLANAEISVPVLWCELVATCAQMGRDQTSLPVFTHARKAVRSCQPFPTQKAVRFVGRCPA